MLQPLLTMQYLLTSRKCSVTVRAEPIRCLGESSPNGSTRMTRIQTLACSACLIFVEVAAAAADTTTDASTPGGVAAAQQPAAERPLTADDLAPWLDGYLP